MELLPGYMTHAESSQTVTVAGKHPTTHQLWTWCRGTLTEFIAAWAATDRVEETETPKDERLTQAQQRLVARGL
jgi:hypothetical protein